jgi:hypothetical protein
MIALVLQSRKLGLGAFQIASGGVHWLEPQVNDTLESQCPILDGEIAERQDAQHRHRLHDLVLVIDNRREWHAAEFGGRQRHHGQCRNVPARVTGRSPPKVVYVELRAPPVTPISSIAHANVIRIAPLFAMIVSPMKIPQT